MQPSVTEPPIGSATLMDKILVSSWLLLIFVLISLTIWPNLFSGSGPAAPPIQQECSVEASRVGSTSCISSLIGTTASGTFNVGLLGSSKGQQSSVVLRPVRHKRSVLHDPSYGALFLGGTSFHQAPYLVGQPESSTVEIEVIRGARREMVTVPRQ